MTLTKFIIRLIVILLVPSLVAAGTYFFFQWSFLEPLDPSSQEKIIVEIAPGKTFTQICRLIQEKGIVRYSWGLSTIARIKQVDTRINAGEYELSSSMSPPQVLRKLVSGDIVRRQVTLREGQTIWELGPALEKVGIITAKDFNPALTDSELLAKAGISAPSFEGYLFPETYLFSRPISASDIIWRMLEEGARHWAPEFTARAAELRMSRHEVLTLASIIEKESSMFEEQPFISAVFHNRLNQGMKLQADPTVIYGIPNFNGNLTKEDLQNATNPYNTYTHFGLPPGPIANPGDTAIKAALYPADSGFLFFVADGNGRHAFASTLQEHNENVLKYQKNRAPAESSSTPPPSR